MRKKILHFSYLVVFLLVSCAGFSQFRFGITGGGAASSVLMSSQIQVDEALVSHTDIQKPLATYFAGFVFPLKVGKRFVIRPGIEYFKKGWDVRENDGGRINTLRQLRRYDMDYVQVPIQILLTTPLAQGRIYIGAGAYAAYAVKGTVNVSNEMFDLEFKNFNEQVAAYRPSEAYEPVQFITRYTVNRIDYGLTGTLGYEFSVGLFLESGVQIGTRQVSTSFERYNIALNRNIRDPTSSVKYSIFHLGIGWMFGFK